MRAWGVLAGLALWAWAVPWAAAAERGAEEVGKLLAEVWESGQLSTAEMDNHSHVLAHLHSLGHTHLRLHHVVGSRIPQIKCAGEKMVVDLALITATLGKMKLSEIMAKFGGGGAKKDGNPIPTTALVSGNKLLMPMLGAKHICIDKEKFLTTAFIERTVVLSPCVADLLVLLHRLPSPLPSSSFMESWATAVVDSWGKPKSSLLRGNIQWLGDIRQCEATNNTPVQSFLFPLPIPEEIQSNMAIYLKRREKDILALVDQQVWRSRYVQLLVRPPKVPFLAIPGAEQIGNIRLGLCLPASCTDEILNHSISFLWAAKNLTEKSGFRYMGLADPRRATTERPAAAWATSVALLAVFGLMALAGTALRLVVLHLVPWLEPGRLRLIQALLYPELRADAPKLTKAKRVPSSVGESDAVAEELVEEEPSPETAFHPLIVFDFRFLGCFGLQAHWRRLTEVREAGLSIPTIDGVRVLSTFWLVFMQSLYMALPVASNPRQVADPYEHSWPFMIGLAVPYVNDTFYFLSGCLLSFHFFRLATEQARAGRLGPTDGWLVGKVAASVYLTRFLRLYFPYVLLLIVYVGFHRDLFLDGPVRPQNGLEIGDCQTTLGTNVFFVHNMAHVHHNYSDGEVRRVYCMPWSWYVGNEMQYLLVAPPILFLLGLGSVELLRGEAAEGPSRQWLWRGLGLGVLAAMSAAGTVGSGVFADYYRFPANPFPADMNSDKKVRGADAGFLPALHMVDWCAGMGLGWVLAFRMDLSPRLSLRSKAAVVAAGWGLAAFCLLSTTFAVWPRYRGTELGSGVSALYSSGSRVAWGVFLGWLVWASELGYGGWLGGFLGWVGWAPLARLSFYVCLLHPLVAASFFYSLQETVWLNYYSMFLHAAAFTVNSYLVAFPVSMLLETPFMLVGRVVRRSLFPLPPGKAAKVKSATAVETQRAAKAVSSSLGASFELPAAQPQRPTAAQAPQPTSDPTAPTSDPTPPTTSH